MTSNTKITEQYISEHRSIKECLKKGLINYSALARLIAEDLELPKSKKKEALLVAARRYKDKIKIASYDNKILELFKKSNIEIKNNIVFFTINKNVYPESLIDIERLIKKRNELFFSIEGTNSITLIFQKNNKELILNKFRNYIFEKNEDLSLITITVGGIGQVPGAVNYISGLFFENGINMEEFISCYDDTIILVKSQDIEKTMTFLKF